MGDDSVAREAARILGRLGGARHRTRSANAEYGRRGGVNYWASLTPAERRRRIAALHAARDAAILARLRK